MSSSLRFVCYLCAARAGISIIRAGCHRQYRRTRNRCQRGLSGRRRGDGSESRYRVTSRAVTDEEGIYRLLYLAPASYNVTYRKAGFSTLQRTEIFLRSNDTLSLDVQLSVGNLVERIEVTAATPLLETATSRPARCWRAAR